VVVFQTNPCGVEADAIQATGRDFDEFQTNPCGVEAFAEGNPGGGPPEFQTNPCGVEAQSGRRVYTCPKCFRRTLVGLKQ